MHLLVANFGSTSYKYRLFAFENGAERLLGQGGFERVTDYRDAVESGLQELQDSGALADPSTIAAVGFKTVLGRNLSGCQFAEDGVLEALEGFREVAPAHNPPYADGIRLFGELLPQARRVALFETAFYQWIPEEASVYALPKAWRDAGIRRYGFHGASHKFIAERSAELLGRDDVAERARGLYVKGPGVAPEKPLRVVSCHLGGSSSVTGILSGVATGTSMGFSPQSGLPQNNRVGDLDSGAIPYAMKMLGLDLPEVERQLTKESGLLGLSGVGTDMRDLRAAEAEGHTDAQLATDHLVHMVRHYLGAFLPTLGGLDALVFTAGIGERDPELRAAVCADLEWLGIQLDPDQNATLLGEEGCISTDDSAVQVWVVPTNEELVVARETHRLLTATP